jgi:hypothetical protein
MAFLRRLAAGGVVAVLAAWGMVRPAVAQTPAPSPTLEDDIKAAYLYNFTKFVEWPPLAFQRTTDPLIICLAADPAFARAVDRIIAGEAIAGRPLRVVLADTDNLPRCQVLFVGRSMQERVPRLLAAAEKAPILTVSDSPRFLQDGGMIVFVIEGTRVRFDINLRLAEAAGLRVSSKLLRVAREVVPR